MNEIEDCLEFATVNLRIAEKQMDKAIEELSTAVRKLEECLGYFTKSAGDEG